VQVVTADVVLPSAKRAAAANATGGEGFTLVTVAAPAPAAGPLAQRAVNPLLSPNACVFAADAVEFFLGWGGGSTPAFDDGVRPPAIPSTGANHRPKAGGTLRRR